MGLTEFLKDITGDNADDVATILGVTGLVISNVKGSRFKKCLFLRGEGNTGKSVLRELAQELVGLENCHTLDIKQLHGQFGLAGIYGKRLVGSGDLKFSRLPEIDKLKELTGGDHVNMEEKYHNSFSAKFGGFLWYNTNDLPSFSGDKGKHVYERFIILSCDNTIPPEKRDAEMLDKLLSEKEIIVSHAVKYLQNAIKNDYKFTESERTKKNREEYAIKNNSLALFLKECCTRSDEKRISTREFKERYFRWCRENDLAAEKPNSIRTILETEFGISKGKSNGEYYPLTINEN